MPDSRPLEEAERELLLTVLNLAEFEGQGELLDQVLHAVVTGGAAFHLDLAVPAKIRRSRTSDGPVPVRAAVADPDGTPLGEVLLWVTHGYLSGLEYAWYSADPPDEFPPASSLEIVF